jgi:hypothetical protein
MNRDPLMTLESIRQARVLLPNPDPVSQYQGYPQIETLDAESGRWSPLKLRARPWTTVAGDGIVSALVSKFFAWDGAYILPFIERSCFIRDMQSGDLERSHFCSPFLVSAICTLQVSQGVGSTTKGCIAALDERPYHVVGVMRRALTTYLIPHSLTKL